MWCVCETSFWHHFILKAQDICPDRLGTNIEKAEQKTFLQVDTLEDDLHNRTDYHLAVGAVTSKILLNVLSDNGLHESALKVATQTTEP
jgi:hypothetical protein|eukprot:COSAG06_NODE_619_length_13741_cov_40.021624_13_plen_89_part_00